MGYTGPQWMVSILCMIVFAYIPLYIAVDRDIETKPNKVYGLVSGQTSDSEFLIYMPD